MADPRSSSQPPVLSILDRLSDDEPGVTRDPPTGRAQVVRRLRRSVRRDLEDLLNTRIRLVVLPAGQAELEGSLVRYGLPDITGVSFGSDRARAELGRAIEATIRRFEPRLRSVRVRALGQGEPLDRTLRFRIDAMLVVEPDTEPVVFDSTLSPTTGAVQIQGNGDE